MTNKLVSEATIPIQESETTEAQQGAEAECRPYFVDLEGLPLDQQEHLRETGLLSSNGGLEFQLLREKHIEYLSQVWKRSLRAPFVSLDASRPWMLYWCLHGCDLLDGLPDEEERYRMVRTMESCWTPYTVTTHPVTETEDSLYFSDGGSSEMTAGGFGGGPGQIAHAATSYAAVLSLSILATCGGKSSERALELMEKIRIPMYRWIVSLLQQDTGGFRMHHDGEVDVRASYTVMCCSKLLGVTTEFLTQDKVVNYIASCQTYEGGLGGEPWSEAHGGYAYCAVAALQLMGKLEVLDLPALTGWLSRRQMSYEGGFSGRSNKLVDGCYSFWQGGAVTIVSSIYSKGDRELDPWLTKKSDNPSAIPLLFDAPMLERYILLCAQDVHGGLRDKPSKSRDFYHSCYNLSGLSLAQNYDDSGRGFGDPDQTKVPRTHPCFNIRLERAVKILNQQWQ